MYVQMEAVKDICLCKRICTYACFTHECEDVFRVKRCGEALKTVGGINEASEMRDTASIDRYQRTAAKILTRGR